MTDDAREVDAEVSDLAQDAVDEREDAQTPRRNILRAQIRTGLAELDRPSTGLFLSALSAGLDIGFGPLFMAIVLTAAEFSSFLTKELLMANAYALGFVFVVLGRSELFTEHTTLAVLPVLDGHASVGKLARLWGLVYVGNVVGGAVFAAIIVTVAPALGVAEPNAFVEIAAKLTEHDWRVLLAASVLAGWLMGLLSWLVAAAQETVSRILVVWIIAASIGFAHLPHSIAGTVEVLAGLFAGTEITYVDFGKFLAAATVGNAIGGSVFVSLLKYGHVVRSEVPPEFE